MKINVFIRPYLKKYLAYKHPKPIVFSRTNIYAMLFFAEWKFRERFTVEHESKHELTEVIHIHISEANFFAQCLKSEIPSIVHLSFNNFLKDMFFDDFYSYMDKCLAAKTASKSTVEIKSFAERWIDDLQLDDTEILADSLLRSYRRYRQKQENDINQLLKTIGI